MRFSKYAALVFLFFCCQAAFSQTVVVTSKEDSGPGTLRAALSNIPANRTATYIINFNLPGAESDYANRTIRLRSQLPTIPSNVIIDGSSQNWPKLGASGAKIIIEPENRNTLFSGLVIGQYNNTYVQTRNVQIYGLCLRNFAQIDNLQNPSGYSGILIDYRSDNIKIGAPGKGNVISGNLYGIQILNNYFYTENPIAVSDIIIQSNIIGLSYDGLSPNSNVTGVSANLYDSSITIGGDNAGEGNVIAANQTNIDLSRNGYTDKRFEINIITNKIGVNATETADFHELPLFLSSSGLEISGVKINSFNTQLYMRNNTISGNRGWAVTITNADFILTGNAIGTNKAGTLNLGNGGGIKVESGAAGTVGGATPAETNLIGYNNYGIESNATRPVKITRNSMFCNKFISIGKALNNYQPFVQVLKKRTNYVSGKATPNAEIEIFNTQNCEGLCEGRTYLKTVQAGSDGKWEYSGTMGINVVATASLLNATTSQFSTAALLDDDVIIEPVNCRGNGSITIKEPREGFTFQWNKILNNGMRQPRGNTQSVTNLEVGDYEVIINDGCKAVTTAFEIKDQKLTEIRPVTPTPACGQLTFNFGASVLRGKGLIHFQWKDADGNIVANTYGNNSDVTLPEGKYSVTATDEANCTKTYNFSEIKRKPTPIIEIHTPTTPAACGKQNGSITGIVIKDATNPKFKWYTYDPIKGQTGTVPVFESSQSPDLINVFGGYYVLVVSDDGGCPPVSSNPIYIEIYDSVEITGGYTVNTTCGTSNGSIKGITIKEGDTFKLTTPNGSLIKDGLCSPGVAFDISNLAAGTYILNASNSVTKCAAQSIPYNVGATPITVYTIQDPVIQNAACEQDNGSIKLIYTGIPRPIEGNYQWKNEAGETFPGTSTEIANLPKGLYSLHITDQNGCASPILGPFQIDRIPLLIVDQNSGIPINDQCGLGRGSVTQVKIRGGAPLSGSGDDAVYKYTWKDINGNTVGTNKDLTNVFAGEYYLEVADQTESRCGKYISKTFKIEAPTVRLPTPSVNNVRVCYATDILVPVIGAEDGIYQLFNDVDDQLPILETKNGKFIFKVSKTGEYQIRRKLGTCYSDFTTLKIEVTNDNLEVMNTMTPNGDGMNDTWIIKGLPEHSDYNIKIYSRSGQLVYESNGKYIKPFDGRFRGSELPAGAYYFIIDLKADCKPLSGSLTLLR